MRPSRTLRAVGRLLVVLAPVAAKGQVTVVDEGTFSLFVAGARVGREDFSIRAAAGSGGSAFVAQGNVLVGERRTTVALNADSAGRPLRFQLTARVEGGATESVSGEARRGVWLGRTVRTSGESAREFRLPLRAVAAAEGVVHHLWFAIRAGRGASAAASVAASAADSAADSARGGQGSGRGGVALLSPGALNWVEVVLEESGPVPLLLGAREVNARHHFLRPRKGSDPPIEVWTDDSGRLLRVLFPALGLEALRDDPPPETPRR